MTFWMSTWVPFGRREQGLFRLEDSASNSNGSNKKAAIAFTAPIPIPVTVAISQDNFKRPEKNAKKSKKSKCELLLFKYIPLAILVFQTAAHVLTVRFASSRPVAVPFLKTAVLFYSEVIKLAVSLLLYFLLTAGSPKKSLSKLYEHFFVQWFDMLKLSVPALAYAIQTVLLYIGLEHLDAGTYSVTYQLKILTTAFFSVLLLKRRLSIVQWMSLFFLLAGVAIVQISADQQAKPKQLPSPSANISALIELKLKANESLVQMGRTMRETVGKQTNATAAAASLVTGGLASAKMLPEGIQQQQGRKQNPIIGLASVLAACFLSGFAGVYVEKLLKQSRSTSVWLQNVQLSALAIPISIGFVAAQDGRKVMDAGLGQGFDSVVWAVVLLQSFGGLVTSVVIKYADNILKAFANSFAIIVISLASIFLFQLLPSRLFVAGAALVIGSTLLYALFPYKQPKDGNKKDINGTDEESSENSTQKDEEDEESKDSGIEDVEGGLPVKEDCEEMPPPADTKKY